jgi:shikimate dehydrogenase
VVQNVPRRRVLVGLIGSGIGLSRSPAMHEAQGHKAGIDYAYRLLDVAQMGPNPPRLSDLVRQAEDEGFSGLNITHPYKQEIIGHLNGLSANAEAIGSVNTVVLTGGKRSGHNTDLWGFRQSFLAELSDVGRDQVLLLGAGGAGAAVAHALLDIGVGRLSISDPDAPRMRALVERLDVRFGGGRAVAVDDASAAAAFADGLVNATPIGMAGRPGLPISAEALRPAMWVADVVYFPIETALLRAARQVGCRTLSGEGMAVFQAVRAFEHFTGIPADVQTMRAAFAAWKTPAA